MEARAVEAREDRIPVIRKAAAADIPGVVKIYEKIHAWEQDGRMQIGWLPGVYPVERTAVEALERQDLFVMEENGIVAASAIINQRQVESYRDGDWRFLAGDEEVMVLHTLTVDPDRGKQGLGKKFVEFYEQYALEQNCPFLRMDTNEKNQAARLMYRKLGYREAGIIPCEFNGIPGVNLVLLEKKLQPAVSGA